MSDKTSATKHSQIGGASGLNSKTITGLRVYFSGSTEVVEIEFSGGSTFVKFRNGEAEYGGNQDFGTGTKI